MTPSVRQVPRLASGGALLALAVWSGCGPNERITEQAALAQRVDRFLAAAQDSGFEGAVLIEKDGQILVERGYGWRDREHREPITPETSFWVASISKQFTASAILKLAEEGKLTLDDSIGAYFRNVPAPRRRTTVHQLLTHKASLGQNYVADGIVDRDAAVEAVLGQPVEGQLGEAFTYSNDAYSVLAALVEVVSGETFESYVRSRLLDPAGLVHTGFWGPRDHPEVVPIEAALTDSIQRPNWGFRGGVGMYSSAADLYRWHRALQEGGVLTAASRTKLQSPSVTLESAAVGYGWFISKTSQGATAVWTRGYEDFGHGAVLAVYPDDKVVIVVTSKSGDRNGVPVSHRLAQDLATIVLGKDGDKR